MRGTGFQQILAILAALILTACTKNTPDYGYLRSESPNGSELVLENNISGGGTTNSGGSTDNPDGDNPDGDERDEETPDETADNDDDQDNDEEEDYADNDGVFIYVKDVILVLHSPRGGDNGNSCSNNHGSQVEIHKGPIPGKVDLLKLRNNIEMPAQLKDLPPETIRVRLVFERKGEWIKDTKKVCDIGIRGENHHSLGELTLKLESLKTEDFNRVLRFEFDPYSSKYMLQDGASCRLTRHLKVI